jgi:hypothetical protein
MGIDFLGQPLTFAYFTPKARERGTPSGKESWS